MWLLIIAIIALGIFTAILGLISSHKGGKQTVIKASTTNCSTCSGLNMKCEQECMMEAATKEIEYYDDEELDAYKGRPAGSYTDQEVEEFSEVMYTMRPEEVKGWNRSLILRGINFPNRLKEELIAIIEDTESTPEQSERTVRK